MQKRAAPHFYVGQLKTGKAVLTLTRPKKLHKELKMGDIFWIIIIATSIWVLVDAKTIGVKKGQIGGMGNLGPWGWFFVCLLLWIVGFPFYLAKRPEYKRVNGK